MVQGSGGWRSDMRFLSIISSAFTPSSNSGHINSVQWRHISPMAQRMGTRSLPSFLLSRDTLLPGATKNREVLFFYGAMPAEIRAYSTPTGLGLTSGRIARSILFSRSISTGTLRTGKSARTLPSRGQHRSCSSTIPNPPSGARNTSASGDRPARVVLIGQ